MTANTPKGIPFPENGIDYMIDSAQQMQDMAEAIDTLFDGYRQSEVNGLTVVTNVLEADTDPVGTSEVAVLTSDMFELTETTQVQLTLSWDALSADTAGAQARFRLRPGNLSGVPLGGTRTRLSAISPDGGGSLTACPVLPAGVYTILATLQISAGAAILLASSEYPTTLLVRPLP